MVPWDGTEDGDTVDHGLFFSNNNSLPNWARIVHVDTEHCVYLCPVLLLPAALKSAHSPESRIRCSIIHPITDLCTQMQIPVACACACPVTSELRGEAFLDEQHDCSKRTLHYYLTLNNMGVAAKGALKIPDPPAIPVRGKSPVQLSLPFSLPALSRATSYPYYG